MYHLNKYSTITITCRHSLYMMACFYFYEVHLKFIFYSRFTLIEQIHCYSEGVQVCPAHDTPIHEIIVVAAIIELSRRVSRSYELSYEFLFELR